MRKMTVFVSVLLLLALPMLTGCEAIKKVVKAERDTWDKMQDDFRAWRKAGVIGDADWATINNFDAKLVSVHNAAVEAGKIWEITKSKKDEDKIRALLAESANIVVTVQKLWTSFKSKTKTGGVK